MNAQRCYLWNSQALQRWNASRYSGNLLCITSSFHNLLEFLAWEVCSGRRFYEIATGEGAGGQGRVSFHRFYYLIIIKVDFLSSVGFKLLAWSMTLSKHRFIFPLVLMYDIALIHIDKLLIVQTTVDGNKTGIPSLWLHILHNLHIYVYTYIKF